MPYHRPIKTIASVGGLYSKSHNETQNDTLIIVSDTEPTTREDGTPLETGDHWFNTIEDNTYVYIETEWKRVLSTLNTSGLELANATVTTLNSIDSATLPPAGGLSSQEDANLWFLQALTIQDEKISELEARPIGGGPGALTYEAEAPLTVQQDATSVTYGFDLDPLDNINSANPFINSRRNRPQISLNSVVNSAAGSFTFNALAPVNVDQQDDNVTYGFMISDLNKI